MEMKKPYDAVQIFHEALAISPQDAIATELLNKALEETSAGGTSGIEELEDDDDFERELEVRKAEAAHFVANRKVGKGKSPFRSRISDGIGIGNDGNSLMDLSDDD